MPQISLQPLGLDGVDLDIVNKKFARYAYVVPMPFRFRIGPGSVHRIDAGDDFEVLIHNLIPVPSGTDFDIQFKIDQKVREALPHLKMGDSMMSDVLIIDNKPGFDDEVAKSLMREHSEGGSYSTTQPSPHRHRLALSKLNDVIVAYHFATRELFGGRPVQRLGEHDLYQRTTWEHLILCPSEKVITDDEVRDLIKGRPAVREISNKPPGISFNFDDLTLGTASLTKSLRLHRRYPFYQFVLDAKTKLMEEELSTALLFSVAAMEGVHAVVLRRSLRSRLGQHPVSKDADSFVAERAEALLISAGFSEMIEMTSTILLPEQDRPPYGNVRACKLGLTIRNEIMHALSKGTGYKFRNRTDDQIRESCNAVLKLYDHFISLLERDEPASE